MAEKAKKSKLTTKKNLLYALWVVALTAVMVIAIVIAGTVSAKRTGNILENDSTVETPSDSEVPVQPDPPADSGENDAKTDTGNEDSSGETEKPAINRITFVMPCENAQIIKRYTSDTIVFNSTLGAYMGHMGIDFSAPEGTEVHCVYEGVIESITTSYLNGTTVTVDHGNNLKTVYNSIEANENLYEGAKVSQGAVLGTVSANNLQEYKDGPHLHFEVFKNGEKIDPEEYLIGEEK